MSQAKRDLFFVLHGFDAQDTDALNKMRQLELLELQLKPQSYNTLLN